MILRQQPKKIYLFVLRSTKLFAFNKFECRYLSKITRKDMESRNENEDVVTMVDVLSEETGIRRSSGLKTGFCSILSFSELSEQASAVLGGSDERNCNGFKKRQALYSCLTCAGSKTDPSKCVGICLACSNICHDNHNLVELYTKRNFDCDCGVKPGSKPCQLDPSKVSQSSQGNQYNQNFLGVYCTCSRPYPDPDESTSNDEMIQCVVCEDWFHTQHIKGKAPSADAYAEMTCGGCMQNNDFLYDYFELAAVTSDAKDESGEPSGAEREPEQCSKRIKLSDDASACVRPKGSDHLKSEGVAAFWKEDWRTLLCKCADCSKMYETQKVHFLTDLEDTSQFYEEKGKGKEVPSTYMASMDALSSLPHVNQIDAIQSYNNMKEKLFEFLQVHKPAFRFQSILFF